MLTIVSISVLLFSFLAACENPNPQQNQNRADVEATMQFENLDTATVAGGCFWCVEASFDQIKGVVEAVSGYAGGEEKDPTYKEVAYGRTGHAETVQVYYDPSQLDYRTILEIFFTAHDPTQLNRQGPDIGPQYRSAIFYHDMEQMKIAQTVMDSLNEAQYGGEIVTELNKLDRFWKAEEYHQDYEEKNPNDRYIENVSRPKINKVRDKFSHILKEKE